MEVSSQQNPIFVWGRTVVCLKRANSQQKREKTNDVSSEESFFPGDLLALNTTLRVFLVTSCSMISGTG
jgi:hypothetical protein